MLGIVCSVSLMNYLLLELSIRCFWTVIDWIIEPSRRKRCRMSCSVVLSVSPLQLFDAEERFISCGTVGGLLVSWWMFGLSPVEGLGANTSQQKGRSIAEHKVAEAHGETPGMVVSQRKKQAKATMGPTLYRTRMALIKVVRG